MKIQLLRTVQIDGVTTEPGITDVSDGYAESLINAGWATIPLKRETVQEGDSEPDKKAATKKAAKPAT